MPNSFFTKLSKRRSATLAAAAIALAAAGVGGSLLSPQTANGFMKQADELADMLDARSPGERQVGELTKTKVAHVAASLGEPPATERALGKVFSPRHEAGGQPNLPGAPQEVLDDLLADTPLTLEAFPDPLPGTGPTGLFLSPPAPGLPIVGPPGGPLVSQPPPGPGGPTVPEVPAVPEPSTWAVLIVGLAFCAAAMRKRRSRGVAMLQLQT